MVSHPSLTRNLRRGAWKGFGVTLWADFDVSAAARVQACVSANDLAQSVSKQTGFGSSALRLLHVFLKPLYSPCTCFVDVEVKVFAASTRRPAAGTPPPTSACVPNRASQTFPPQ
jgi:hypothetical protein